MIIQYNTDKNINGDERHEEFFSSQIADELSIYEEQITRIEVHISDENGKKENGDDIKCILEARLKNRKPIAVSAQTQSIETAVSSATDKLRASLKTIMGKVKKH